MKIPNDATALSMAIEALRFYAEQWEHLGEVTTRSGQPRTIFLPTNPLFSDQGIVANRALIALEAWQNERGRPGT